MKMNSRKPTEALGINPGHPASGSTDYPSHIAHPNSDGLVWSYVGSFAVSGLSLAY